jgi:hypothetical protein
MESSEGAAWVRVKINPKMRVVMRADGIAIANAALLSHRGEAGHI